MSGNHTFDWDSYGVAAALTEGTITVSITGGTVMTSGKFVMDSSEFALYQTDSHVSVAETYNNHWEGSVNDTGLTTYTVGVYPKAINSSTSTQKSAEVSFTAGNSGGSNSSYMTAYQAVAPPAFTMANAGITGFAVAQNGSITAPQASAGTITNRVYSSGGSYGRVCGTTQRSVVVYVRVPGGWSNTNDIIFGTYYTDQPASPTFSFGTWDGSVSVDVSGVIFVNVGNAASATINTSNFGVTYGSDVTRTISVTVTVPSAYCNSGEQFTDNKTATQPGTPIPTLNMNISAGCTGYVGSGYIEITSVSNGSGNYTYHVGSTGDFGFDVNNPNTYNLNSAQYGLSNGNYNVAVYDSFYHIYAYEIRTISCASPPPPTFYFTDWNGIVSVAQDGTISTTNVNATVVSVNTGNFGIVYNDTSRTINVTITVPGGYSNSGNQLTGDRTATQPASPPADPTVSVYTLCNTYQQYFIIGNYSYPKTEILGYCATYAETTTKSVAQGLGYTEFSYIAPSTCDCY